MLRRPAQLSAKGDTTLEVKLSGSGLVRLSERSMLRRHMRGHCPPSHKSILEVTRHDESESAHVRS